MFQLESSGKKSLLKNQVTPKKEKITAFLKEQSYLTFQEVQLQLWPQVRHNIHGHPHGPASPGLCLLL